VTKESKPKTTEREGASEPRAERPRRALGNVGGPIHAEGDPALCGVLARALEAAAAEDPDRLTHGFHAYPARMHPAVARTVIAELSPDRAVVVDPFCGSGTVLLEAMLAGRRSTGVDLNPLALRVAEVKCARRDGASRTRFAERLAAVAQASEARVRGRVDARAPLTREQARWWDPHVLKELAGLREEIRATDDEDDRRALEVLLSAVVVKFSRRRSDTAEREEPKRIRKGLCTEFFLRRGQELCERWAEVDVAAPPDARAPLLLEGDARRLPKLLPGRRSAHLILTSPPYGGTYDYVRHHELRFPWLGLDPRSLERQEIGSRRDSTADDAASRWDEQLGAALSAMSRSLRRGASAVLLLGDAQLGRRRVDAARQVRRLAPRAGLELIASASQPRVDRTGGPRRREHLLCLRGMPSDDG